MNKRTILAIATSFLALAFLSVGIVSAWFLNLKQTQSIEASTSGIVFSYTVDSETTTVDTGTNCKTFDAGNLTFFGPDDPDAAYCFTYSPTCVLVVEYTNKCKVNIDINIDVASATTPADGDPYCAGIITGSELEVEETVETLDTYFTENELTNEYTISSLAPAESAKIYLYLYGYQPTTASNNDFLSESYGFTLTMTAIKEVA